MKILGKALSVVSDATLMSEKNGVLYSCACRGVVVVVGQSAKTTQYHVEKPNEVLCGEHFLLVAAG